MILKTYEFLKKKKLTDSTYLLFGNNEGYQNEIQSRILEFKSEAKILRYDEKEFFEVSSPRLQTHREQMKNKRQDYSNLLCEKLYFSIL